MDAVTSVTAAKMRALREAKKLGCAGAHKTEDGRWHPCSSAETLQRVKPGTSFQAPKLIVPPKSTRTQRGANNIQRQWEPLGSRGIVAIDTIAGGGLVSGVVGKAYQPAAPRDEDPDVFTDIEAARDRSRQLGCIGVSRRISRSGRTIWMPCTNMSDLSNRTGRTALGRRNMQKRSERFIMDAIRKAKPKAERRRAKSIYEDLHGQLTPDAFNGIEVKRLGPKVGQGIGRGLRSAPNGFVFVDVTGAIDADKDGIVFEGKPLERPIIPKFIVPEGAGRRISKLFEGTAITNEENRRKYGTAGVGEIDPETFSRIAGLVPESIAPQRNANERDNETIQSMRSIFGGLRKRKPTTQKRKEQIDEDQTEGLPTEAATGEDISSTSRKKARKEVSGVLRNIDEVTDEYEFYGYTDLKELVAQMVPTSLEELEETLRSNPFTRNYARRLIKRIAAAEPDFEAAQVVRTMLQNEVGNTPGVAAALRQFGMPPIVVTKYQPDVEGMGLLGISGGGPEEWNFVMGGYASSGFIAFNTEAIPNPGNFDEVARARGFEFRNIDVDQMLRHELAHAWEVMAAKQNPRSLEHYVETLAEMHENLKRGTRNVTDFEGGAFEPEYRRIGWGTKQERASARKISEYAETARVEWFAESFAAYTDDSYAVRATVDNVSIQNMADVFGISVNEFVTRFSNDRGRGSRSNLSAERLATLGDRLLGMRSARMKEAIDWYDEHPDYLEDAPLDLLVRMSPDKVDAAFSTTIQSMRSASDSAARARVSNDPDTRLGQQILDAIFGRAKRKNMDPDRPTLWFLGGTTGSGKSRMRQSGVFVGVPTPDEIPDIDPDEIKKGHPRWDGGKGALEIHRWSTQWTRYGRRQAIEQQRDHVITGTGVRTEQLSDAKRAGYTTIGHFVYTPVDVAEKRMRARAKDGGTNLPLYKAQGYSDDLRRTTTDAILRGDMDEFYLYDNSIDGANPSLAVQRTRDGRYQILNQRVFEAFLGKENARRVERYWSTIARDDDDPNGPSTMRSMRSAKSPPRTEMFRKQFIRPKDLAGRNMRHSYLGRAQIDTNIDLSEYDWSHSQWVGIDLKPAQKILKPFNGRFMLVSESTWDGVRFPEGTTFAGAKFERVVFNGGDLRGADMSGTELWGVDFSPSTNLDGVRFDNAIFARATFRGSDLRNSGITVEQIQSSGIEWDDATKFPPEVQQYIDSLQEGAQKIKDPTTGLTSLKNLRETTTPNIKMAIDDVRAKRRSQPPIRPNLDEVRTATEVVKGVELSRTSLLEEDAEALTGKSLASGFARFTSFVGRKLRDAKFIQMDMENADLTDAELVKTSFTSSILRRARFIGAKIRETVSFRGSDLTDTDFTDVDFGKDGKIDLRGARLMGTTLGKMAPKNILWDNETDWRGAKWEIDVLPRDLQNSGITQIRMRSMRGGTANDARTAISTYNDTIINWKSLSKNERQDFIDEFTLSYRDLLDSRLNAVETNEVLKGELATANSLDEQIERLTSLLTNDISPLMDDIKNNNYRKFAESFRSAKQSNPEFMRGRSARAVFNDAQALMIRRDASRTRANGLRTYRNNEIEKSKLLDSMRSLLLDDLYTADALKKPTGSLPRGTRSTEPLIPNTESLRSRRIGIDKPTPLSELSPDFSDTFPATDARIDLRDTEGAKNRLQAAFDKIFRRGAGSEIKGASSRKTKFVLKDVLKNDLLRLRDNDFMSRPVRESLRGNRERLLGSLRIVFDTRDGAEVANLPTLHAEPYEPFKSMVDSRIEWSKVYLPLDEDVRALLLEIPNYKIGTRKPEMLHSVNLEYEDVRRQYAGRFAVDDNLDLASSDDLYLGETGETFLDIYEMGMRNAELIGYGHDAMHLAVGRGFDRHGEYAATLADISAILQIQELSDEEKNLLLSKYLESILWGNIAYRSTVKKFLPDVETSVYDMRKVFDAIIRHSTYDGVGGDGRRGSMRSLRNANDSDIDAIAEEYVGSSRFSRRLAEIYGIKAPSSLRSNRRINLLDAQYDELDTIAKETGAKPFSPDAVGPAEVLRRTLVAARTALKYELGKSISAAPGIGDEEGARMRDSIRVEIAPNRIPMLIAQPFKAIVDELPDKRDWSTVLAPSLDDARRLAKAILEARKSRSPLPMKISEEERSKILEQIYGLEPFQRIIDKIVSNLGSSSDEWTGNADSFVQLYLQGIRHPQRMQGLPGSDGVHDFFGHAGIGRGFDRHGEFAAALTTDSLLRDHQEFRFFTPDEREFARREFFDRGVAGFLRIRENARLEFSQKHGIDLYADETDMSPEQLADRHEIEDIFNIIFDELNADVLDRDSWRPYLTFDEILDSLGVPPSTTRASVSTESPSMRSARRSIPLTDASDELLLSIAQQEADIKLDRSMRSVRRRRPITEDERARFRPLNLAPDQKMKIQPGTKIVFVSGGDQVFHSVIVGPQVWRLRGVEGVDAYIDPEPPDQEFIDELVREWNDKFGPVDSPSRQAVSRGGRGPSRGEPIGTLDTDEDPVERNIRQAQEARERRSMRSSRPLSTDDAAVLSSLGVVVPISVERDVRPVLPTSSAPPMPRTRRGQDRPQISTLVPRIRTTIDSDGRLQIDARDKKRFVLNHSSIIDNLKISDIPDDYKPSKRMEKLISDTVKQFESEKGAPLLGDERQQMIQDMRLKLFKYDIRMAIVRDSLFPNDDGTLSAEALRDGEPGTLFAQSSIANLAEGESIFITDIPGTSTSSMTKHAIVSRIDGILVMTELTDPMAKRLKNHVSGKPGRDSFSGASINTFDELVDVSHFPGGVEYNQLDETRDAITRLGESIRDFRSDIPKPHVILKQDYALYPPGSGQVVKEVAGIANLEHGGISFFGTSRHHLGLLPITHEWGHFIQHELRRRGKFNSGDDGDWTMAMFLDKTSMGLADIPKGEYITAPIPGGPIMTFLKGIHVPKINSASVTEYGTTDVGEDWAESVALFLIDKRVGWLLHEPDASGKPKEGGRKITFAELYPQRTQLLERHLYGKEATTPQALIGQPDNNGGTSVRSMRSRLTPDYDKRFKDKYGSRVPSGDGDCFSAAHDMLSTLRKQPYNFTSDQIRLVHGTPLGTGGEAEGIRFPHAWVEVNTRGWSAYEDLRKQTEDLRNTIQRTIDEQEQRRLGQQLMRLESQLMMQDITIYDYSNGNEFEGPRVLYYAIGNIREEDSRYYSTDDATKRMMENEHYGPWE